MPRPASTARQPPDAGASGGAGASVAAPDASGLVAGKPAVTTDGGKVMVAGLGAGKSRDFDLPAGSATMVISPCVGGVVSPFVSLYDGKDNKVALTVDPTTTLKNLAGGSYYVDVARQSEVRLVGRRSARADRQSAASHRGR